MEGYCIIRDADNDKFSGKTDVKTPVLKNNQTLVSGPHTYLGLVNRDMEKEKWWTMDPKKLMVFRKKESAEYSLKRLKHGNPKIVSYEEAVRRITHWFWKVKEHQTGELGRLLKEKMTQWHDDDWNEGINAQDYNN